MPGKGHVVVQLFLGWWLVGVATNTLQRVASRATAVANFNIPVIGGLIALGSDNKQERTLVVSVIYLMNSFWVWPVGVCVFFCLKYFHYLPHNRRIVFRRFRSDFCSQGFFLLFPSLHEFLDHLSFPLHSNLLSMTLRSVTFGPLR